MEQPSKLFSRQLLALLAGALVIACAPAVSAIVPAIATAFPQVSSVYIGLFTTIPALFLIGGIFLANPLEKKLGGKITILTGLALVAFSGTLPVWSHQYFSVLFISRCVLGIGIGLFNRLLIQQLSRLYQSDPAKKAQALGLESACEGLDGIFMTVCVGQLVKIHWSTSFLVYGLSGLGFILIALFVPNQPTFTAGEGTVLQKAKPTNKRKVVSLGLLLFSIVLLFIHYNLRLTPLLLEQGLGDATNGSNLIAAIAVGAFIAGNLFGVLYSLLHWLLLPIAVLLAGLSMVFTGYSASFLWLLLFAACLGVAFRTIMPYFMHLFTTGDDTTAKFGATVVLIAYNLGTCLAPYVAKLVTVFVPQATAVSQVTISGFVLCGIGIGTLVFKRWMKMN